MSKLLDLPEGTYKCTKTKVKNDDDFRMIEKGHTVIGEYQPTIVVGQRFMAQGRGFTDYVNTSIVKDFKLLSQGRVEIETENSLYLLEEVSKDAKISLT